MGRFSHLARLLAAPFWILGLAACAHLPADSRAPASIGDRKGREPLVVRATLHFRCVGDTLDRHAESPRTLFFPERSPFIEANGGLVPLLTSRLQLLGDQLSRDAAIEACGGGTRVTKLIPESIRSGTWSARLPFDCSRHRCVISPYDESVSDKVEFEKSASDPTEVSKRSVFEGESQLSEKVSSRCKHPIRAKACYGDCMSNDSACTSKSAFIETLATPSFEGEEAIEICGDPLAKRLDSVGMSKALRPLECRIFFIEEALRRSSAGFMCAAFRVQIPDCDRF